MTILPKPSHRLIYFLGIGATAALVHLSLVLGLVNYGLFQPLIANVFAYLIAFNVSYLGHKHLTFSRLDNQKKLSLAHFFIVSSSAGLLNELIYFILLKYTALNYMLALIIVLGIVAFYTYFLSKFWACR